MQKYLSKTDIPIEIWFFDPTVSDEFYTKFRKKTLTLSDNEIKELKIRNFQIYKHETTDFLPCNRVELSNFNDFVIIIGDGRTFLQNIGKLNNDTKVLTISTEEKSFFSDININHISLAIKNLNNN